MLSNGQGARDMGIGDDPALKMLVEVVGTTFVAGGTNLIVELSGLTDQQRLRSTGGVLGLVDFPPLSRRASRPRRPSLRPGLPTAPGWHCHSCASWSWSCAEQPVPTQRATSRPISSLTASTSPTLGLATRSSVATPPASTWRTKDEERQTMAAGWGACARPSRRCLGSSADPLQSSR